MLELGQKMKYSVSMWKHKKLQHTLWWIPLKDWCGFLVSASIVVSITAYGFSLSVGSSLVLESAPEESLALVAVAVVNNVGTDASRTTEIPVNLPADVSTAETALVRDALDGEVFFSDHFRELSEYEEVARIDIPPYLNAKTDRQAALEYYIEELTRHTKKASNSLQAINAQILVHKNALTSTQTDIKNTQAKIEQSYRDRNSTAIMDGVAELDELILVQQDHKYGQVFGQQIASEYQNLIQFSEAKLAVLQANMPALVQWVTVNLPKWTNVTALEELKIFSRSTL